MQKLMYAYIKILGHKELMPHGTSAEQQEVLLSSTGGSGRSKLRPAASSWPLDPVQPQTFRRLTADFQPVQTLFEETAKLVSHNVQCFPTLISDTPSMRSL